MANGGNLKYNVSFDVKTSSLEGLKKELKSLQQMTGKEYMDLNKGLNLDESRTKLREIKSEIDSLQNALSKSYSNELGGINFSTLKNEIQSINFDRLTQGLESMGVTGRDALRNLSLEVLSFNTQVKESHTLLSSMAETMGNTIKWGISSSAMNSFSGAVQTAYNYILDLDKSLTNIQIVTQNSNEEMQRFAKYASQSAQALGSSTTDYTDAALIYYQQGLSTEEVEQRTDTTVKMANVLGSTVKDVSSYMTSIWNNFAEGSDNLESYADIITALGAATASSSEEIAEGLSKFASVSDTIGLSYNYATSALATVVAQTRQSADTVGTAFKTIFSRLEGLSLGQTADDGTSLNKYSQALAAVGVNIKDQNDQLKSMDTILDELGEKWGSLRSDTKMALAQTVAGTRQYTQLVSLMDNWDTFKENLQVAENAEGTLTSQQDTYMNSAAAHIEQMKQSWEDLYDSIANGDSFKGVYDSISNIAKALKGLVEIVGGGESAFTALGAVALKVFSKQIAGGITTTISNLKIVKENTAEMRAQTEISAKFGDIPDSTIQHLTTFRTKVLELGDAVSKEQEEAYNNLMEMEVETTKVKEAWEEQEKAAKAYYKAAAKKESDEEVDMDIDTGSPQKGTNNASTWVEERTKDLKFFDNTKGSEGAKVDSAIQELPNLLSEAAQRAQEYEDLVTTGSDKAAETVLDQYINLADNISQRWETLVNTMEQLTANADLLPDDKELLQKIEDMKKVTDNAHTTENGGSSYDFSIGNGLFNQAKDLTGAVSTAVNKVRTNINNLSNTINKKSDGTAEKIEQNAKKASNNVNKEMKKIDFQSRVQGALQLCSAIMQVSTAISTLKTIPDIFQNNDLTTGEKVLKLLGTLGTGIMTGISAAGSFAQAMTGLGIKIVAAGTEGTISMKGLTVAIGSAEIALGPLLLILGLVTVAVAAVAIGISKAQEEEQKYANAAADAAEITNQLTTAYEEAEEAAKNFKETVSEYEDATKGLEDLTKGTTEYKEAIEAANEKAKELIKTMDISTSDYTYDANGLITFNDGVLDKAQAEADEKEANLADQVSVANSYSAITDLQKQQDDFQNKLGDMTISLVPQIGAKTVLPWEAQEKTQGTEVEWGHLELTQDSIHSLTTALLNSQEVGGDADLIATMGDDDLRKLINNLDGITPATKEFVDEIVENKESLASLAEATSKVSDSLKEEAINLTKSVAKKKYGTEVTALATDKDGNVDDTKVDMIYAAIAKQSTETTKYVAEQIGTASNTQAITEAGKGNDKLKDYLEDKGQSGLDVDDDEDVAKTYATYVKGVDVTNGDVTVSKDDSDKTWNYTQNGEKTETGLDIEAMRKAIAEKALTDSITTEASKREDLDKNSVDVLSVTKAADALGEKYNANLTTPILSALAQGTDFSSLDLSSAFKDISSGEKDALMGMSEEDLLKTFGLENASEETAQAFYKHFRESLGNWDVKDINAAIGGVSDNASSLYEKLQSGEISTEDELKDDEDYTAMSAQLENLKSQYPEVTAAAEILNDTWLVGTQEYTEALAQVQDAMYAAKQSAAVQEEGEDLKAVTDLLHKDVNEDRQVNSIDIEATLQTDEFDTALDELTSQEHTIDVAIHTEAEDEFNDVTTAIDNISEQAKKIGTNYKVAASDVRELGNAFPGILENAKTCADGTIQLDKSVVKSSMETAKAEVANDAEATINKLKTAATILRAKQASYEQIANAAKLLASSEIDTEEEKSEQIGIITTAMNTLKEQDQEAVENYTDESNKDIVDNTSENAEQLANDWASAYQESTKASYNFAKAAIQNMGAVTANDESKTTTGGNFTVDYTGSGGVSGEAKALDDLQSTLDEANESTDNQAVKDKWAEIAETYSKLATSAGDQAEDIESMITAVGAEVNEAKYDLGNVENGTNGSNSSSSSEADKEDMLEDELDIYHDINVIIKEISNELSQIQAIQKSLTGQDLIDNLNEQLSLLNNQVKAYEQKLKIANEVDKVEQQSTLSKYGVKFNSDGTISNYTAVYTAQLAKVNAAIAKYNAMSASAQEKYKDTLDQIKENFETFTSAIDEYDELITSTIPEIESSITQTLLKEIEIQITEFNMEIKIRLDLKEAEQDWNSFKLKVIDGLDTSKPLGSAQLAYDNYSTYYNKDEDGNIGGIIKEDTEHVNEILAELEKINNGEISDVYSKVDSETGETVNDTSTLLENLKTYYKQLMTDLEAADKLITQMDTAYVNALTNVATKMKEVNNMYDTVSKTIKHDMNTITLVYGKTAYDKLAEYYSQQVKNNENQLAYQKTQVDYWKEIMDAAEEGSDEWDKAKTNWVSAVTTWESSVETAIKNLQSQYSNAINEIFQNINDNITGGSGLSYANTEWSLLKDNADDYLDSINAMYGIQKIANQYQDSIDATDNLNIQKELNAIMEDEISTLKEKDELTQYDLDRAQKRYEIAVKQMELEEAQQNKSTMRLRRDSQGNYSYQYVADEDKIGELKDTLSEMYNSLYNLDTKQYQSNLQSIYDVWTKFQKAMSDAAQINDPAERSATELLIKEQYGEMINRLTQENESIRQNMYQSTTSELLDLYDQDESNYQNMTVEEQELLQGFWNDFNDTTTGAFNNLFISYTDNQTKFGTMIGGVSDDLSKLRKDLRDDIMPDISSYWDSGIQEMADKLSETDKDGFVYQVETAYDQITEAAEDYEETLSDIATKAGVSYDDIADGIDDVATEITKEDGLLDATKEIADAYQTEADNIETLRSALSQLTQEFKDNKAAAEAAAAQAIEAYEIEQTKNAEAAEKQIEETTGAGSGNGNGSNGGNNGGGTKTETPKTTTTQGDGKLAKGDKATFTGKYYSDSYGGTPTGTKYAGTKNGVVIDNIVSSPKKNQLYYVHIKSADGKYGNLGWVKPSQLSGYDTGGYTGDWGTSQGRIAMLHQKELVLNASDTENMLQAVDILRNITSALDNSMLAQVLTMLDSASVQSLKGGNTTSGLEQNVHIEANFPNVSSSNEIETALKNLVNTAAQRANKKNI